MNYNLNKEVMEKITEMLDRNSKQNRSLFIGIDTGTHTGVCIYCGKKKEVVYWEELMIHQAFKYIDSIKEKIVHVCVEDARLRKWFGKDAEAKKQGVGYVKAHSKAWDNALDDWKIPYTMIAPIKGGTYKGRERQGIFHRKYPEAKKTLVKQDHLRDSWEIMRYCKIRFR